MSVLPQKGALTAIAREGQAGYNALGIDNLRFAVTVAVQNTQIDRYAVLPEVGIVRPVRKGAASDDFSRIVDRKFRKGLSADAGGIEVDQLAVLPKERMRN